jgi:hypothetical protein
MPWRRPEEKTGKDEHARVDGLTVVVSCDLVNGSSRSSLCLGGTIRKPRWKIAITCYPFNYVGHAPKRMVIEAELEKPEGALAKRLSAD